MGVRHFDVEISLSLEERVVRLAVNQGARTKSMRILQNAVHFCLLELVKLELPLCFPIAVAGAHANASTVSEVGAPCLTLYTKPQLK